MNPYLKVIYLHEQNTTGIIIIPITIMDVLHKIQKCSAYNLITKILPTKY